MLLALSPWEIDLRLVIGPLLGLAMLTGGCDRENASAPQGEAARTESGEKAKPETSGTVVMTERGAAMPDVPFKAPDGGTVKLSDFKGRPVLVNLWATWCGPCVAEMPTLDALAKRQAEKLQVIVVAQEPETNRPKIDKVWTERKFERLTSYVDGESDLGFAFGTGMVPTTVLYDAEGREVWRVVGAMNWDGPRANTLLSETIG
jgi:thiol-disulfide isomerase/thioredoxin